jgi:hypothetical protein
MAKHRIENHGEIDVLNKAELRAALDTQTRQWFQEQARGITTAPFDGQGSVSGGAVTIPAVGSANRMGPKAGFAWVIRRIDVVGLLSGDSLSVYRDVVSPHNFLGTLSATQSLPKGIKSIVLRGDQHLVFNGTSLTATGDIVVNGEVTEVPEPDLFKVL